jgi:hypothetical protein
VLKHKPLKRREFAPRAVEWLARQPLLQILCARTKSVRQTSGIPSSSYSGSAAESRFISEGNYGKAQRDYKAC